MLKKLKLNLILKMQQDFFPYSIRFKESIAIREGSASSM
jgi:hypothetical protein